MPADHTTQSVVQLLLGHWTPDKVSAPARHLPFQLSRSCYIDHAFHHVLLSSEPHAVLVSMGRHAKPGQFSLRHTRLAASMLLFCLCLATTAATGVVAGEALPTVPIAMHVQLTPCSALDVQLTPSADFLHENDTT